MKNDNSLVVFIAGTKVTCNEDGLIASTIYTRRAVEREGMNRIDG